MSALPFDVPDDVDLWMPVAPVPVIQYLCDQPVLNQGGKPYPCTAPAKWRATATDKTDDGCWVTGYGGVTPPVPFKVGEHRNVCGIHAQTLERRRWKIEALPGEPEVDQ